MNDPEIHSSTWEWDMVGLSSQWRYSHNYRHHVFTNVLEMDDVLGFGAMRLSRDRSFRRLAPNVVVDPAVPNRDVVRRRRIVLRCGLPARPRVEQRSPSINRCNAIRICDTAVLIGENVDEGARDTLGAQPCFASSEVQFTDRLPFRAPAQLLKAPIAISMIRCAAITSPQRSPLTNAISVLAADVLCFWGAVSRSVQSASEY